MANTDRQPIRNNILVANKAEICMWRRVGHYKGRRRRPFHKKLVYCPGHAKTERCTEITGTHFSTFVNSL